LSNGGFVVSKNEYQISKSFGFLYRCRSFVFALPAAILMSSGDRLIVSISPVWKRGSMSPPE